MSARSNPAKAQSSIAVIGIDIGKNVFHVIGLDARRPELRRGAFRRFGPSSAIVHLPTKASSTSPVHNG